MSYKADDNLFGKWLKFQWWMAVHAKCSFPSDFFNKFEEQLRGMNKWTNYTSMYPSISTKLPSSKKNNSHPTECICPCCNNQRGTPQPNRSLDTRDMFDESDQTPEDIDPSIDVIEWDKTVSITIEAPTISERNINPDITEGEVIIKIDGEQGRFYKKVRLPCKVDEDSAITSYQNGVIDIELKKKTETNKKK